MAYICSMEHGMNYNTQETPMVISEYGRTIQKMIGVINAEENREKRTSLAEGVIQVMISLNPQIKELDDYEHKLWDHLQIISDYTLDVDAPFPKPEREAVNQKPNAIPYKEEHIKFRFYGRNLQQMVEQATELDDPELKKVLVNYIASFMVNSSRNWNDENLDKSAVINHLKTLSKGDLKVEEDDLEIYIENRSKRPRGNQGSNKNKNKNYKKNKSRNR